MREKLVRSDLLECIIGLGPNLFYNSPMEACIIICRAKKRPECCGQVLFINAVNEVTRKNAQSYLEDRHIKKIAAAYENMIIFRISPRSLQLKILKKIIFHLAYLFMLSILVTYEDR